MSIKGFQINGNIEKYDYNSLDNIPTLPAGGSTEEWEHICDVSVVEDTENPITLITQDLGANYKKLNIFIDKTSANGLVASGMDSYPLKIYANNQNNPSLVAQFGGGVTSTGWVKYSCEIDYNAETGLVTSWSSICTNTFAHWKVVNNTLKKSVSKLIFYNNANTGGFRTFTMKIFGVKA